MGNLAQAEGRSRWAKRKEERTIENMNLKWTREAGRAYAHARKIGSKRVRWGSVCQNLLDKVVPGLASFFKSCLWPEYLSLKELPVLPV